MTAGPHTEYQSLRDTIRQRGTVRVCAVLGGLMAWGALAVASHFAGVSALTLVPLVVLAATFEINFFIHTGVERVGRYIQVFYEEREGAAGWETIAMSYGKKFPSGLDPLFSVIFSLAAAVNFLSAVAIMHRRLGWILLSLAAHLGFGYRIVNAKALASSQRTLDLERFRNLANER